MTNSQVVRELIAYCLQHISSLVRINKIYGRFKSQGQSVGKNSLYEFMGFLEEAYCLFAVPLYTLSAHQRVVNPKKLYCNDQGLITAYTVKPEFEEASRLENTVFCKLRRETENIFYYKRKKGREVDFLVLMPNGQRRLFQVCVSLSSKETLDREMMALREAMKELGLNEGVIVTLSEKKMVRDQKRRIVCIPAWEWLLKSD